MNTKRSERTQLKRPTKYWVIVASKDHVEYGKKSGIIQANHGRVSALNRMQPGDWVLMYSSKLKFDERSPYKKFTGIAQVKDGQPYQVEMEGGFKPFRRDGKWYPAVDVDILPLIPKFSFIRKKESWGFVFKFGFFEIPEKDFNIVADLMLKNKGQTDL